MFVFNIVAVERSEKITGEKEPIGRFFEHVMRRTKNDRTLFYILVVASFFLGRFSHANLPGENPSRSFLTHEEQKWLRDHPVITYTLNPDYAPIEFLDDKDGKYKGISADYMTLLETKLNIRFTPLYFKNWKEIIEKARKAEVDILPAVIKDREKSLLYTEPYLELTNVILVRKEVSASFTMEELQGMKVAFVPGYVSYEEITQTHAAVDLVFDLVPNVPTGLKKVSLGMDDAMVTNLIIATYYIEKEGITNLRIAGTFGQKRELAIGSRKDWPELNRILQKGVAKISKEEREAIYAKWIHLNERSLFERKGFWIGFLGTLLLIFVVLAGILTWNRSLKHQVDLSTKKLKMELFERQLTEKALKESEEWLKSIFDGSRDAVFITSEKGEFVDVNEAAVQLTGYSKKELLKMSIPDVHDSNDLNAYNTFFNRIMNGESLTTEAKVLRKDGTKVDVEFSNRRVISGGIPYMHTVARDINERKQADEKIKKSLQEKELLLREIHHRVKNNLQVISSLLSLQSRYSQDKETVEMFRESQERIRSMALIHEKLYQSESLIHVDFVEYIKGLVNSLYRSYKMDPNKASLEIAVENISLDIDSAVPCGLIINELVSNVLKHAFPPSWMGKGKIKVSMHPTEDKMLELIVEDNGVGWPKDLDFRKTESLGLRLITILVEDQLNGKITLDKSGGTKFRIMFKA